MPKFSGEGRLGLIMEIVVLILEQAHVTEAYIIWPLFILGALLIADWIFRGEWREKRDEAQTKKRAISWAAVACCGLSMSAVWLVYRLGYIGKNDIGTVSVADIPVPSPTINGAVVNGPTGMKFSAEKLKAKYVFGYSVFQQGRRDDFYPSDRGPLEKYDVDWSPVRYTEYSNDYIRVDLPKIKQKDNRVIFNGGSCNGPKPYNVCGNSIGNNIWACTEVLVTKTDGVVFVIAFQELGIPRSLRNEPNPC